MYNRRMPHEDLQRLRHSLAHLLAAAVGELYPAALPTIGPATDTGFYYDFDFGEAQFSSESLPAIEAKMRELLPSWEAIEREEVSEKQARAHFKHNSYKLELIDEIVSRNETITLYRTQVSKVKDQRSPVDFVDLCRGGHVESPNKEITPDAFTLSHIAGAYWRGDEKNKMLTRIYGVAFFTKDELDAHLAMLEEAKKRDHKKLGPELDLFTFSPLVGGGLPLWTPKGTLLRQTLDEFVWQLRRSRGYERVEIPHITKRDLYEQSGHWDKFKEELFKITTREGHEFAMKPMNCPHHAQIYARRAWSYRDLPQRYANTTMVYRDEQSGELAGLSRVRAITQDDAHVFCRFGQATVEMSAIWDIITEFYGACGFALTPRLSLHDPREPEKYLGDSETWERAEHELRGLIREKGATAIEAPGEAAFYGPKIDFMARDSLAREWQLATIQLDMNQPERFDLTCINEKGGRERIVMIHAAIMGSIERYLAILIEHFAGAFPLWLSPAQVRVLPISEPHHAWAREVFDALRSAGIRVELDEADETLGRRIRAAKIEKLPYFLVLGEKEVAAKIVTLEGRDGNTHDTLPLSDLLERLQREIREKKRA